eukprot:TRINITY_DN6220_c0_g1_i1.p1 TRINITY_DN6220_c0_g1~~TRINITY_DN6220_c0_g1_i1.p1  ORF type:complete len:1549 (-),score=272.92 TRINITY_DN6220_c0_g1_i1:101-4747(-)
MAMQCKALFWSLSTMKSSSCLMDTRVLVLTQPRIALLKTPWLLVCQLRRVDEGLFETDLDVLELEENEWHEVVVSNERKYYKFYLAECKTIAIDLVNLWGGTATLVSTTNIPLQELSSEWTKQPWLPRDSYWISPGHVGYRLGWYYITTAPRWPSSAQQAYKIRVRVLDPPVCEPLPAPIEEPSPEDDWLLLEESRPLTVTVAPYVTTPVRFYVNQKCANFTLTVRQAATSRSSAADIHISTDPDNQYPNLYDGYRWTGQFEGDDSITITNYCSEDDTIVFYIGVWTFLINEPTYEFQLTGTTAPMPERRIADFSAIQLEAAMFEAYTLECPEQTFACEYIPYSYCLADGYNCCYLRSVLSTPTPNFLLPSTPTYFDEFAYFLELPYESVSQDFPTGAVDPKKLTFEITLSFRNENGEQRLVQDISACTIHFQHRLQGAQSRTSLWELDPVELTVEKELVCDAERFKEMSADVLDTIASMKTTTEYASLQQQRLHVSSLLLDDTWAACEKEMESFFSMEPTILDYGEVDICTQPFGTEEFWSDSCCNMDQVTSCCLPRENSVELLLPKNITSDLGHCQTSECSQIFLDHYSSTVHAREDLSTGCSAIWSSIASDAAIQQQTHFATECVVKILGNSLSGAECTSDDDCREGHTCSQVTGTCDHTYLNVLDCWVDSLSDTNAHVGQLLFISWNIFEPMTPERMRDEILERFLTQNCVGYNALQSWDHYAYSQDDPSCEESCDLPGDYACLVRDEDYCPTPEPECGNTVPCWRSWKFQLGDSDSCDHLECSWMSCADLDADACTEACMDQNVPDFLCVSCESGECVWLESITNEADCLVGLCSVDPLVTDPNVCEALGTCSESCPTCDTEAGCIEYAYCGTANEITSSVCVTPYLVDLDGSPYCEDEAEALTYGCVYEDAEDKEACEANGSDYTWIEAASTEEECNTLPESCLNSDFELFIPADSELCDQCSWSYQPYASWVMGNWIPAEMQPKRWVAKSTYFLRMNNETLDYSKFNEALEAAIISQVSASFATETLCQYSAVIEATDNILCDCFSDNCTLAGNSTSAIGFTRGCPFVEANFFSTEGTLYIAPTSLVGSICIDLTVSSYSSSLYQFEVNNKLTSAIFFPTPDNEFCVVVNDDHGIIGQILSNGFEVIWDENQGVTVDTPFFICIPVTINSTSEDFKNYGLGVYDEEKQAIVLYYTDAYLEEGSVCADITSPGNYFAVKYNPDWEEIDAYGSRAWAIMSYISASLYFLLALASAILFVSTLASKDTVRKELKVVMLIIFLLFSLARGVYFSIPPYLLQSVYASLLFEIPTFLYILTYVGLLYIWSLFISINTPDKSRSKVWQERIFVVFTIIVIAIVLFFAAFLIAFFSLPEAEKLTCSLSQDIGTTATENKEAVNLAYQIYVIVLSISLASFVLFVGFLVIRPMWSNLKEDTSKRTQDKLKYLVFMTLTIGVFCSCFFITKSALMLWSALKSKQQIIIIFCLLEIIPCAVFLYYYFIPSTLRRKKTSSNTSGNSQSSRTTRSTTRSRIYAQQSSPALNEEK